MTPQKPYLIRAINDWLNDNNLTPHLLVDTTVKGTQVPTDYITDGKILLNIHYQAIENLKINNDIIFFEASFNQIPHLIHIPTRAVLAIYASENNLGMVFDQLDDEPPSMNENQPDTTNDTPADDDPTPPSTKKKKRSFLKVIK